MANRASETSRQRRARENRARRAALEARKKAAATPREERVQAAAPKAEASTRRERRTEASEGRKGGNFRETLAQGRLGQVPVDPATLEGRFLGKVVRVPGGMQVVMASVLVLVLTLMGAFMDTMPEEGAEVGSEPVRTIFEAYGAGALLFLAPPLILVGNALFFSLHVKRRRMWMISAVMLGVFSILMPQFLFPAGFLGYAAFRAKRIEDGPRRRPVRGRAEDADGDGDAVAEAGDTAAGSDAEAAVGEAADPVRSPDA